MTVEIGALVDRARDDDAPVDQQHAAFAELVRRFEEAAFAWSLKLLHDPEEARDVCQDAFITAWLKLRQLRDAAAFGGWLRRLIVTQCARRRRRSSGNEIALDRDVQVTVEHHGRQEQRRLIASALAKLGEREHRVVVMFYFLGRKMDEIAAILGIPAGTVGKLLHSARLAIRRNLPRSARGEFVQLQPSRRFLKDVKDGLLDEYIGEYRFDSRPERTVRIERQGEYLVSESGGQRTVLVSLREGALAAVAFDGEGRFKRDHHGRVVQFAYYECGARLGIARKLPAGSL